MGMFMLLTASILNYGCSEQPQARIEEEGLLCPIDTNLKATINRYFTQNPIPAATRNDTTWIRAIVLKKDRIFTTSMDLALVLYCENGELRNLTPSGFALPVIIDMNTPVGSEVWFFDKRKIRDEYIHDSEIRLIKEDAVCIPDRVFTGPPPASPTADSTL